MRKLAFRPRLNGFYHASAFAPIAILVRGCIAFHCRDLWVVQTLRALAPYDDDVAFVKFKPYNRQSRRVVFCDERLERLALRRKQEAVVNKLAVFWNEGVARVRSQSAATTAATGESLRSCSGRSRPQAQS